MTESKLIFKLKQNGISGGLLNLFENYLDNRKQRVVLNGYYSETCLVDVIIPTNDGGLSFRSEIDHGGQKI